MRAVIWESGAPASGRIPQPENIYAQIIDDKPEAPSCPPRRLTREFDGAGGIRKTTKKVGLLIAKRAREKGIESVVFDRSGYLYHGRVKELAEGAREGGLKF